ncbi:MAG: cell surface protein SprA [Ignavibacteria bacterium]|jgi:cell surface protein SprA
MAENLTQLFPNDSLQTDSLLADSIGVLNTQDSLLAVDTTKIDSMALDSTARLRYFKYYRKDYPYLTFREKKQSGFFASDSRIIRRVVELDSTGQYVIIREMVGQKRLKPYLTIPLEEYMKLKLAAKKRKSWEALARKYERKEGEDDLGQFITDITNIEIPLPSTSFLSIFGPPKISLKISGAVDIHGAWRSETTEGITTSSLGNTTNEPDFEQQVQINVNGTIGDKLTISADWNTERDFEYENQLKIKYTGYEDEIIQSIEAGNVSLQTTSLVGGSEALFGIKANMQLGPLSLTALASQKKGETEEVSITSGSSTNEFELHAYEYSTTHYFVDTIYANRELNIFNNYFGNSVPVVTTDQRYYHIKEIEVWKTTTGSINLENERKGNAFIDLPPLNEEGPYLESYKSDEIENESGMNEIGARFVRLEEGVDYILADYNKYTGFISFKTQINDDDAIAVAYRIEGTSTESDDDDLYYGEFNQTDTSGTIVLKLIKPSNLQPQFETAWKLQLKNIYPIGGLEVDEEGFALDILYEEPGQEAVNDFEGNKLLEVFGLDLSDQSGTSSQPDGEFDYSAPRTILPSTGEIIFPVLEPFGRDLPDELPDSLQYTDIYDTTKTFAKQKQSKDRFLIQGEYSASVSSVYTIGFNVVENSVKVYLAGNELSEGTDYTVDYNIGQVQIRADDALVAGADLKITYETNDLFSLASKTLLGLRGVFDFSEDFQLGFSYLSLNQETLSDKVRIGEEPLNNAIMGVDLDANVELPFITDGLSNIISTNTMSSLSLQGEFAYMNPDPNTKKSPIPADEGQSIAYVDDFEGAKTIISIGVNYTQWKDLSPPDNMRYIGDLESLEQLDFKAKTFWYNISPSNVYIEDIYADRKQASRDDQQVTALDFVFRPDDKGTYNRGNRVSENYSQNWGGMMAPLSSTANNLVEENIDFIEFWLHADAPPGAKMYIDLGQISEDVIPNKVLDSEDENSNDRLEDGEDNGIDGLTNDEERASGLYNNSDSDPAGDDFYLQSFSTTDPDAFEQLNGGQGNASLTDAGGTFPDTEDLDNDFYLDKLNSYFRYEIPLDTNKATNEFIKSGGDNAGWYLFRIPLKDYVYTQGDPSFSVVETIRLWIQDVDSEVHLRFAEFNLVGNQWQKVLNDSTITDEDTVLTVATINYEDDIDYVKPPGVVQERDETVTDTEVYENEQSLQLVLTNLEDGQSREAVKYLYQSLDVFDYTEMKFFVHGDLNNLPGQVSWYEDTTSYATEIYFRFGADPSNYYEYRQPVTPDWNEVKITFDDLTALKQNLDSVTTELSLPVSGKPGHSYGVKGSPTLTKISFFLIGILNPSDKGEKGEEVSGEIWINELRVLGADDSPGWAFSGSSTLQLADLLSVSFNMSQTDPYFHGLSEQFGSRIDKQSYGLSVNFNLLKLIPFNLSGSNLNLKYSRTESIQKPLYEPGTDISVEKGKAQLKESLMENDNLSEEEASRLADEYETETHTLSLSETWTAQNIKLKLPSKAWYIEDIINSLTFGFNYNTKSGRSPTIEKRKSWVWNASASYALNLGKDNYFKPVDIPLIGDFISLFGDYKDVKFYFTPQGFNAGMTAKRNWSYSQSRTSTADPSISRDFTTTRSSSFNWILSDGGFLNPSLNYNLSISNSLDHVLTDVIVDETRDEEIEIDRSEDEIWDDIFKGEGFGKPYSYKQNVDLKLNPNLPSIWSVDRYLRINASYGVTYNWSNNFEREDVGRSAGYSNRLSASLNLKLKSLMAPFFQDDSKSSERSSSKGKRGGGRRTNRATRKKSNEETDVDKRLRDEANPDSTLAMEEEEDGESVFSGPLSVLRNAAKWLFFDYEQITLNFSQTNTATAAALLGEGTGFLNFWGFRQDDRNGPNRAYMLGLDNKAGPRALGADFSDSFVQKNQLDFRTQRPLWEGASIDLSWNVGWGVNKTIALSTSDTLTYNPYRPDTTTISATGTIERSFLSFPQVFFLPFNNAGIKKVAELYDPTAENPDENLNKAFVEGFESIPLLGKTPFLSDFMKFIPRPNWSITWGGMEKLPLLENIAKRASLSHAYQSTYSEGWKIDTDGIKELQSQKVSYAFSPLIGLNLTFAELWGGSLTGSVKYSTRTNYSLGVTTRNITESLSRDISFNASYSKKGFELPLFGVSLKNDIEVSLSYTNSKSTVVVFEMDNFDEGGTPQDGTTRVTIEPRIRYVMSSRVTLSLFYSRTQVQPEGTSTLTPTTTNEAGLDVHISIQ